MEKPKLHVVSFSGGKDSTAMLLRMIEEGMRVDLILYCDTGLEFPEMAEHIRKVEEYIGRKITVIKSEKDFMYYATEMPRLIKSDKVANVKPGDIVTGKLRFYRPALWGSLREMDRAINEKCPNTPGNDGSRVNFQFKKSLTDIERRFEVEDEFIALGKKLRTKEFFQALRDRGINY